MTLSHSEMKHLELRSASFIAEGHKAYLPEAINAVRTSGQPDMALHLLAALSSNARGNQEQAIADVRRWIEHRLREEPSMTAERFLLELGWLRRLCVTRLAEPDSRPRSEQRGRPRTRRSS
jgi:hypothetical protein